MWARNAWEVGRAAVWKGCAAGTDCTEGAATKTVWLQFVPPSVNVILTNGERFQQQCSLRWHTTGAVLCAESRIRMLRLLWTQAL